MKSLHTRRWFVASSAVLMLCAASTLTGCSSWNLLSRRAQSPDDEPVGGKKTKLVGEMAEPFGNQPVEVNSVGLVVGLPGTGCDPPPSEYRAALLTDMKKRSVERPNEVLASDTTALVLVTALLRPGIQKGDSFDIKVRVPELSETTSLRGGRLLETELKQLQFAGGQIHEGKGWGVGTGPVLVDPSADPSKNRVLACQGFVLGGGRATQSRSLGLVLKPNHQNVFNAGRIATVVNKRFHHAEVGIQEGVAKPENEKYIELAVHPRYKNNVERYMQVVRSLAVQETAAQRMDRVRLLEKQLLDPVTSWRAALQLEAIGADGVASLKRGVAANDPEVRFRSAEALAYLDQSEAAKPLGEAARNQPAFRVFALTALGAMNDVMAYDELCALLDGSSAETRYGAFRALWSMNANDSRIAGEMLGDEFSYHPLDTQGPAMIHVTRSTRPELVLFGREQSLRAPFLLEAGPRISITSNGEDQVSVSRYAVGQPDQKRVVSTRVDDVVRAVVDLGGTYPDVVQALQQAKAKGALTGRFEVDALPEAGRTYHRGMAKSPVKDAREAMGQSNYGDAVSSEPSDGSASEDSEAPRRPFGGFFARMVGRDTQ